MADQPPKAPSKPALSPREQRLAQALRANLRRRKAADRAQEPKADESDSESSDA